jgi:hypothetical protein
LALLLIAGLSVRAIWRNEATPPAEPEAASSVQPLAEDQPPTAKPVVSEPPPAKSRPAEVKPVAAPVSLSPAAAPKQPANAPDKQARGLWNPFALFFSDKPAAAQRPRLVRRDSRSEGELMAQLAAVPELTLQRAEFPRIVQGYAANYSASHGRNLEPSPVLGVRSDLKQLPYIRGDRSRLSPSTAARLTVLSRKLHGYLEAAAPKNTVGQRPDPVLLRETMRLEKRGKKPEWLRPEAVPVLRQLLMHEDRPIRMMLVELLNEIPGKEASVVLAERAVFDVSREVRDEALAALGKRPQADYSSVLLRGLRHPWVPAADHAAEALVTLQAHDALPQMVDLLEKPEPNSPYVSNKNRYVVRELVRVNHQSNCLMCHPPSVSTKDPVPGIVPEVTMTTVSSGGGGGYGASARPGPTTVRTGPLWVRADVAFLRQDFSVGMSTTVLVAGVQVPTNVRTDFLVRIRPLTEKEIKRLKSETRTAEPSRQRQALLYALRELAGKDRGTSFEDWKELAEAAGPKAEADAKLVADQLVKASADKQPALLARLRDGKGLAYTEELALVVPKLDGDIQGHAREALTTRLTRMRTSTLREKLRDKNAEIRRAAIRACVGKDDKALVPELIVLVEDSDLGIARLACRSLADLTGHDLSLADAATPAQRTTTAAAWKNWWKKQGEDRAEAEAFEIQ